LNCFFRERRANSGSVRRARRAVRVRRVYFLPAHAGYGHHQIAGKREQPEFGSGGVNTRHNNGVRELAAFVRFPSDSQEQHIDAPFGFALKRAIACGREVLELLKHAH